MSDHQLQQAWTENLCGDRECEAQRLEAALLVLKGHESDHRFYARVVAVGKQEITNAKARELYCHGCKRPANTECVEQKHHTELLEVEDVAEKEI